jgi:hypothetical protein
MHYSSPIQWAAIESQWAAAMSLKGVLAATLVEPGKYDLREYPLPDPQPGGVLVKMEISGICGTDKHTCQGYTLLVEAGNFLDLREIAINRHRRHSSFRSARCGRGCERS